MKTYVAVLIEKPQRGASNEYPEHMFPWRNKKTIYFSDEYRRNLSGAMNFIVPFPKGIM